MLANRIECCWGEEGIKEIDMNNPYANLSNNELLEVMEDHGFGRYLIREAAKRIRRLMEWQIDDPLELDIAHADSCAVQRCETDVVTVAGESLDDPNMVIGCQWEVNEYWDNAASAWKPRGVDNG